MQIHKSASTSYDKSEISKPQTTSFYDLKLDEKIAILHILMETVTETPSSGIGELSKNGHEDFKVHPSFK
jgi:phage-related protein